MAYTHDQEGHETYYPLGKLVPTILDELAANAPDRVFGELPLSQIGYESGVRPITYRKLANAVNGIAKWIIENLGPGQDFETISYVGPNDMGHSVVILAAIKTGHKCLLTSPRYGVVGQVRLMKATGCKNLLLSPLSDTTLPNDLVVEHGDLRLWTLPPIIDLFDIEQDFPYTKSFEEGKNDPMLVLHTSGTTGFPRPIIYSLEWGAAVGQQRHPTPMPEYEAIIEEMSTYNKRIVTNLPPFHIGFFLASFFSPLYTGSIIIHLPSTMPPTTKTIAHVAQHVPIDTVTVMPGTVEDIGLDTNLQDICLKAGIKTICWAGGPVAQHAGSKAAKLFNIFTTIGSTEAGAWNTVRPKVYAGSDPFPFNGMCFHPDDNIEFRDQGDGLYLAFIVRHPDPKRKQPVFCLFPDENEYDTKDLFRRHSSVGADNIWFFHGRADDMQIFPTGFTWHPSSAEERVLAEHRDLFEKVLMTVAGPNVVVLVEPSDAFRQQLDQAQQSEDKDAANKLRSTILDRIWPTMEDLQKTGPIVVRFDKSRFIFTDADRPMPRTAKGTVQRKLALTQYEDKIQAMKGAPDCETIQRF
ncbi:NRPS-like enzyme [Penicillium angulare]|uniref:NRPS-like enzyme n=1 Tax=Penicillium angulare TaxID=116970 RepID=A0A9W9FXH4_9EURO|nr:NRPS-like enzyme [Penicillium angulare]